MRGLGEGTIRVLLSPPFSERLLALLLPCIPLCVSLLKQGDSELSSSSCLHVLACVSVCVGAPLSICSPVCVLMSVVAAVRCSLPVAQHAARCDRWDPDSPMQHKPQGVNCLGCHCSARGELWITQADE